MKNETIYSKIDQANKNRCITCLFCGKWFFISYFCVKTEKSDLKYSSYIHETKMIGKEIKIYPGKVIILMISTKLKIEMNLLNFKI